MAGYINQYGNATQEVKISCPAGRVYSVEIIDELAQRAIQRLKRQGYTNVEVRVGNGHTGWPKQRPVRQGDSHSGASTQLGEILAG